ncbi:AgmX/PglI C-terminal domain-containing protein [Candidatus Fermentibacteria bacterium]|nr:AgmX/PglI C-terminal domain-containing protein [Candidatus Fermentibacteria bacterium]
MVATPAEKRVLAVAVMREGKVVNKLIPGKDPVRLGSGYNNDIVAEGAGLPDSMVLISPGDARGVWVLRLEESMEAKIESSDGSKLNFADLKGMGIFPRDDEGYFLLNIKQGDQGQISVGPFVIHFGFITPPKTKPKPKPAPAKVKEKKPEAAPAKDDRVLKIIVERTGGMRKEMFPNAGIMTIGNAAYNTVSVENPDLPRIHTLLEPIDGKYLLRLVPPIKGGVEVKGNIIPFDTLIERNLLKQEAPGEPYTWELDKNVTGVFKVGDTEIAFTFAKPPEKKEEKPKKVVREKFKPSRYEWRNFAVRPHDGIVFRGQKEESSRFQVIIGVGLAIALLTGAVLDRIVMVTEVSKSEMLRRAPTARVASLADQTPAQTGEAVAEEIISDVPTGETMGEVSGGGGPPGGGGAGPAGVAAGQEAADNVLSSIGFAAYGTGSSGGGAGIVTDLQSAASSGLGLASGESGQGILAGSGGGGSGGIDNLVGAGGGVADVAETVSESEVEAVHRAASVSFNVSGSGEALDLGYRDLTSIRRRVNVIKMRVQTAYENLLRSNPTAGGRITLHFDITPSGSVTNVNVQAPSDLSGLKPTIRAAIAAVNFGPAPEQTANLPMTVPFNLVPPE